jgi:hypothetical protein
MNGACIVHQNVNAPLVADNPIDHRLDLRIVGMVAANGDPGAACLCDGRAVAWIVPGIEASPSCWERPVT